MPVPQTTMKSVVDAQVRASTSSFLSRHMNEYGLAGHWAEILILDQKAAALEYERARELNEAFLETTK